MTANVDTKSRKMIIRQLDYLLDELEKFNDIDPFRPIPNRYLTVARQLGVFIPANTTMTGADLHSAVLDAQDQWMIAPSEEPYKRTPWDWKA